MKWSCQFQGIYYHLGLCLLLLPDGQSDTFALVQMLSLQRTETLTQTGSNIKGDLLFHLIEKQRIRAGLG